MYFSQKRWLEPINCQLHMEPSWFAKPWENLLLSVDPLLSRQVFKNSTLSWKSMVKKSPLRTRLPKSFISVLSENPLLLKYFEMVRSYRWKHYYERGCRELLRKKPRIRGFLRKMLTLAPGRTDR